MAVLTDSFETFDAIGNREDLSDVIWDVSPSDTPFLSAIGKTKATGVNHEWQTDVLATPGANAHAEGEIAAEEAITPTVRMGNYTQILTKTTAVTGTQEKVTSAGRKSEMARAISRRIKEIKMDLEYAMINGGGAAGIGNAKAAGSSGTAREMGSIQCYLTNASLGATGAVASGAGTSTAGAAVMTTGTDRDFAEAQVTSVLQDIFTDGGDPRLMFMSAINKGVASGFTGGGTHYVDKDDKKLVNSVDVYVGDFHTLSIVPSRIVNGENVLIIDPSMLAYAELRPLTTMDLAVTGDNLRKYLVMEGTLEVRNDRACGIIADTNG